MTTAAGDAGEPELTFAETLKQADEFEDALRKEKGDWDKAVHDVLGDVGEQAAGGEATVASIPHGKPITFADTLVQQDRFEDALRKDKGDWVAAQHDVEAETDS